MNEGKPTKAKWWSRPRTQGASGEPEEMASVPGDVMPREVQDAAPATAERGPGRSQDTDGDFELARPGAARGKDRDEGDFELARPAVPQGGDADYELERPAAAEGGRGAIPAGGEAEPGGSMTTPAAGLGHAPEAVSGTPVGADAVTAAPGGDAERPKPLHAPDPYSTPPYGEPGPWAPAPPVRHPAATPAHGTATPAQPPAPGTPLPVPPPTTPPTTPTAAAVPAPAGPTPPNAPTPPYADAPPPTTDPWHRYDPWAASTAAAPWQQNGAAVVTTEQRRRRTRRVLLVGAALLALVSGGVGGVVGAYLERNGGVGTVELPQAGREPAGRAAGSVAGIAAQALPSVVTLHVSGSGEQGTGTGFVLDTRGHILTNNHVVDPAGTGGEITVTFHSGDTAEATVVGRDSGYDLAVVKVKGVRGLTPLPLGNSDNVRVGDPVVAIGAPFDLAGTVTSGIISAKERPITAGGEKGDGSDVSYVDALQTDAPINPGNSGGPLLDSRARVIGINSAIRSADSGTDLDGGQSGSIGLGFAIPINQGKRVAEELINTGKATHPVIGITLDMDYTGDGARVGTKSSDGGPPVTPGGPGARAGIRAGDVITEVDGQRIHSGEELIVKTRAHRPGDRLELTLKRDGKERKVSLSLGSSDGD
ncbi:trypsin-like peptidase domain-containing protein [Streptomyces deserti]